MEQKPAATEVPAGKEIAALAGGRNHGNVGTIRRPWQDQDNGGSINDSIGRHPIKTENEVKKEVEEKIENHVASGNYGDHVPFHSEDDDIEVFIFDRNNLKLKSEKIQRKRSTEQRTAMPVNRDVKRERSEMPAKNSCKGVASAPAIPNSDSGSGNESSSGSSDSSSSDSSSSNSSDSDSESGSSKEDSSSYSTDSDSSSSSSPSSSSSSSSTSSSSSSRSSCEKKNAVKKTKSMKSKIGKQTPVPGTEKRKWRKMKEELKNSNNFVEANGKSKESVSDSSSDDIENIDALNSSEEVANNYSGPGTRKSSRLVYQSSVSAKNHENRIKKKLRVLLKKPQSEWTDEDRTYFESSPKKFVHEMKKRLRKEKLASERLKESEDPEDVLEKKCLQLATIISRARYLIIYTGAGISTSAKIPDYRGPNGIWTLLQKGQEVTQSLTDFSQTAEPTLTHMAIKELWERGLCKHVVSQNVDGLHLRSGIPKVALSEVHGNMYVEACVKCGREFVRLFDVTENTRRHHHKTGRFCYHCGFPLRDSIVLFGEKGSLRWPLNWEGAEYHADKADLILCLGSSLKVLRRYPWLWCMSKAAKKRPKLCIVNLQWTPKDQFAQLKINGKCDEVMQKVMNHLGLDIPVYTRKTDAIFTIGTALHPLEVRTKTTEQLSFPDSVPYPDKNKDLRNYIRFEPNFKVPVPYENLQENSLAQVVENGETSGTCDLNECKQQEKPKKRVIKGNNFGWLGNTVANKQQKKRKFK